MDETTDSTTDGLRHSRRRGPGREAINRNSKQGRHEARVHDQLRERVLASGPATEERLQMMRRAVGLTLLSEQIECGIVAGKADASVADCYTRVCGQLARLYQRLGLLDDDDRPAGPSDQPLREYLARRQSSDPGATP